MTRTGVVNFGRQILWETNPLGDRGAFNHYDEAAGPSLCHCQLLGPILGGVSLSPTFGLIAEVTLLRCRFETPAPILACLSCKLLEQEYKVWPQMMVRRPSTGNFCAAAPALLDLRGGGEIALDSEAQKVLAFSATMVTVNGLGVVFICDKSSHASQVYIAHIPGRWLLRISTQVFAPDIMCTAMGVAAGERKLSTVGCNDRTSNIDVWEFLSGTLDKVHLDYGAALVGWGVGKWTAASTSKEASVNFAKLNLVLFLREEGR